MDDLVQRLHALSRYAHDDRSIGSEAADAIERLTAENFALAAGQCVNATSDEGGTPRCAEIARLTAERDSLSLAYKTSEDDVFNLTQKVIPNLRAERDALQAKLAESQLNLKRAHGIGEQP